MLRPSERTSLPTIALAAVFASASLAGAQTDERKEAERQSEPSVWMTKKLEYSKEILAGLADGDYDAIQKNAQAMQSLSKFEAFIRARSPEYRSQMQLFQDANREIIKQAKRKNLEGAALGFTQLTISCVNCHKNLRETPGKDRALDKDSE